VEGELDDISGSGQTEAVHEICSGVVASEQKHLEVPGAGHYGIFSGRRWRELVYPHVKSFILTHQPAAKPVAGAAVKVAKAAAEPVKATSSAAKAPNTATKPVSAAANKAPEAVKTAAKKVTRK